MSRREVDWLARRVEEHKLHQPESRPGVSPMVWRVLGVALAVYLMALVAWWW